MLQKQENRLPAIVSLGAVYSITDQNTWNLFEFVVAGRASVRHPLLAVHGFTQFVGWVKGHHAARRDLNALSSVRIAPWA